MPIIVNNDELICDLNFVRFHPIYSPVMCLLATVMMDNGTNKAINYELLTTPCTIVHVTCLVRSNPHYKTTHYHHHYSAVDRKLTFTLFFCNKIVAWFARFAPV